VATGCYPPSSGCAIGYYWDTTKCICTYSQAYFDRLAYEKPTIISCIKNNLSESEYQTLRYLVGTNQKDKVLISSIYEKVKSCYLQTTTVAEVNITPGVANPKTPLEKESCLISLIGERAYSEINSGIREATYLEKFAFGKCYPDKSFLASEYITNNEDFKNETISCLKSVLGVVLYESVRKGEKNVPYELASEVDKCFGANVKPFVSSVSTYRIPGNILSCLKNVVGDNSFNLILSGQLQPTEEEKKGAKTCFDKLNSDQSKFVPPPVEQVPYLLEVNEEVKVNNAKQEVSKKRNKVIDNKIILNGKGPKDSVVTIYVFSEPIVVTTKTDENGDWIYELNDPVTGGKHIAYATVKTGAGDVRSSVFSFDVSAAEPDVNDIFVEESKATPTISKFMIFSLSVVGVGLLLLLSGIFIIRRTDENQHNFLSTFKRLLTGYRVKG
jgi:hypothetical protein